MKQSSNYKCDDNKQNNVSEQTVILLHLGSISISIGWVLVRLLTGTMIKLGAVFNKLIVWELSICCCSGAFTLHSNRKGNFFNVCTILCTSYFPIREMLCLCVRISTQILYSNAKSRAIRRGSRQNTSGWHCNDCVCVCAARIGSALSRPWE